MANYYDASRSAWLESVRPDDHYIEPSEQMELFRQLRAMDPYSGKYKELKDRLVLANIKLVLKEIGNMGNFQSTVLSFEDLCNTGCVGLEQAVRIYDPNRGTAFSSIAVKLIKKRLQTAVAKSGFPLTHTTSSYEEMRIFHAVKNDIFRKTGHEPKLEEIADQAGWSLDKTMEISLRDIQTQSLYDTAKSHEDHHTDERQLHEMISDKTSHAFVQTVENKETIMALKRIIEEECNEVQKDIMLSRIDPDRFQTFEEIGRRYNRTGAWAQFSYKTIRNMLLERLDSNQDSKGDGQD